MDKPCVVVTGGTGCIGSFLVEELLKKGYCVRVPFRNNNHGYLAPIAQQIEWMDGDLSDPAFCRSLLYGATHLFHLAAYRRNIDFHKKNRDEILQKNLCMTKNLISACPKDISTTFFSTALVGMVENPKEADDGYIAAKASCEQLWQEWGGSLLIMRPINVYGPRDRFTSDGNVIPSLMLKAKNAKDALSVWGSGKQERAFLYAPNLAEVTMLFYEKGIIGTEYVLPPDISTIKDLAIKIIDIVHPGLDIEFDTTHEEGVLHMPTFPQSTVLADMQWTSLDDGLRQTFSWWQDRQKPSGIDQRILVIIPSYNESENILSLVDAIHTDYPAIDIMVVDDNSPDGTAELLQKEQNRFDDHLHIVVRTGKGGRGSAVLEGFRRALVTGYDLVFEMDADFSHKPEEIQRFLEAIQGYDMVVGSRYLPGSEIHNWGWKRTFFSKWANRYARLVLGIPISDYTNGFRCYTKEALSMLDMSAIEAKGYVVLSEVAYQLHKKGMRIAEVPTVFVNRCRGESNLGFHEIFEAFFSVIRVRSKNFYLHAVQASKFILCGLCGAVIDLGSLYLFVEYGGLDPNIAFIPSTMIAAIFVFFFNKYVTFGRHEHSLMNQMWRFFMVYSVAFLLNVFIAIFFHWLGLYYIFSKALAIGIVAVWNYVLSHSFIFVSSSDSK